MRFLLLCLLSLAAVRAAPVATRGLCGPLIGILDPIIRSEAPQAWASTAGLSNVRLSTLSPELARTRVKLVVEAMYRRDSAAGKEFDASFHNFAAQFPGGSAIPSYLGAFDIYLYSPEYQAVLSRAHHALPRTGRVLDVGAGSGVFSAFLQKEAPDRAFTLVDRHGFQPLAAKRFAALAPRHPPLFGDVNLGMAHTELPKADHAVLNQVLYTMVAARQKLTLEAVARSLPKGGTLFINEPVAETMSPPETKYKEWLTRQISEGVANGAPHTDFQVALMAGLAAGRLGFGPPKMMAQPRAELEKMITDAGFEIDYAASGWEYGGFTRAIVARRK